MIDFGLNTSTVALVLLGAVGAILLYIGWLFLRNPVLVKIGLRNIPRRPTQSILIVLGLTLSTVIIVSSLAVGDTLSYSIRRQAVDAYGATDEILAPPLISLFASLASGDGSSQETSDAQAELERLTEGGLTSVLAVLEGGLPSISEARFRRLQTEAQAEPLIDGVAGSIVFPTIIRDVSSGQGEPLGFIFAVDDDYDQQFGLVSVTGTPLEMEALEPGVGNIFAQASNLFNIAGDLTARVSGGNVNISNVALATAAVGAALTGGLDSVAAGADGGGIDLAALSIDTATLRDLGIDTTVLDDAGIDTLSLDALGLTPETLEQMGVTTTTVNLQNLAATTGIDTGQLQGIGNDLLGALNLNTLGRELDALLAQAGLQLRQGDIYLNRLGAERLNAHVGDVVEIYIGPIPIPFRIKGIVEQAGPMAALTPVVMMPLDEAQKLLFMRDKVNAILVSNEGDVMSGIQHTQAVSNKLRTLAMDDTVLAEIAAILRRPDVNAAIVAEAPNVVDAFGGEFDGPGFMQGFIENMMQLADFAPLVQGLPAALEQPEITPELRAALASQAVRDWLLNLDIPADATSELRDAFTRVNEFDIIDPLSKANIVTVAGVGGTVFTSIFSLFGIFSILAAVLLIFLIFVMLAAERRSEMGMARAIGVRRGHLVQMFMTEGLVYDLIAAALGVLLGLGISYLMVGFIGGLFNTLTGRISEYGGVFSFRFNVTPASAAIAYALGVLFTFLIVVLAARRVSRLNIVAAIRDLPESDVRTRRSRVGAAVAWLVGPLVAALGGLLIWLGLNGRFSVLLVGVTLALVGIMLLVQRVLARTRLRDDTIERIVYSVIGAGILVIWALPWATWTGRTVVASDGPWVLVSFALTMPMVILGAILVVMYNADLLTGLVSLLLGGVGALTPVLKTAIAYPLSARFRTGMAMLLFAMVISTVTIMSVVIHATQTLVTPDSERYAGFEIGTSFSILSFFNPLDDLEAAIAANPDFPADQVAAVGAVATTEVEAVRVENQGGDWRWLELVGVNQGYLNQAEATYDLTLRAPGYADDAAVWEALRTRDDVAVLTRDMLFGTLEGRRTDAPEAPPFIEDPQEREDWEREFGGRRQLFGDFAMDSPALPSVTLDVRPVESDLPAHQVEVIAVIDAESTLAPGGLQVGPAAYAAITGAPFTGDNYYIKVVDGADVRTVAQAVERSFLSSGMNASILAEQFAQGQALTRGILRLFQGFMALGLLVGIAALGVISSRTVVERRQQVGMLRAIGFQPRMVALSFLFEASFIALTGLLIGAWAGLSLGRRVIGVFLGALADDRVFTTPWWAIIGIVLLAYVFALLATLVPAYQAARVYPAEALRYE
ncbi:MAG: FtsX-like permease family protein [Caldilineaceae bacterium]|nr:FtsX-like permease family protein [Caldilineaceae bacterium]